MTLRCVWDLLAQNELSEIENAPLIAGRRHPTWRPIFHTTPDVVDCLTNSSVANISEVGGEEWLRALRPRLRDLTDGEAAAAALAELRAYGGLVQAGYGVKPIARSGQPTPDFVVDAGDGQVVMEVFTKHQDDEQTKLLEGIAAGETPKGVERSVIKGSQLTIQTTVVELQPGGAPDPAKPHDSVQANLISRVCSAKGDETQFPPEAPSLLWIDFRSFGPWPESLGTEQTAPLISGRNGICSGALWYAFYGWHGAPIFEETCSPRGDVAPMGHNGRFRIAGNRKSKLSGVILALSDGLVLFENPWAKHPLPDQARRLCERLPFFHFRASVCNWSPGDALMQAELGRRQIEAMERGREFLTPGVESLRSRG